MKINRISVYRKDLPYVGGEYGWGRGNIISIANSSIVVVETDTGISGVGEYCPCGENYMVAHSEGTEAAARLLAPALLGRDPREIYKLERVMDNTIKGHGYAKAPFDAAFWDILGKSVDQPVWMLLGGRLTDGAPMYRVVPQKPVDEARAEMQRHRDVGYRMYQIKVGNNPHGDADTIRAALEMLEPGETAFADANQGWTVAEAVKIMCSIRDLNVMIEQPCETYEECLHVRQHTDLPMKLDECVTGLKAAQRIVADRAAEVVCHKISNLGGLSKARRVRDFCVENGLSVVAEDTWGGEITTAALAHFAASTPPEYLYNTTDLANYNTERTGTPRPLTKDGKLYVTEAPGLGVEPDYDSLGDPVAVFE